MRRAAGARTPVGLPHAAGLGCPYLLTNVSILPAAIIHAAARIDSGSEKDRLKCCKLNFLLTVAGEELNPIHILPTVPHDATHPQRTSTRRRKFHLNLAIDGELDSSKDRRAICADIAKPGVHQLHPVWSRYEETYPNIHTEPFAGAYCLIFSE